MYTFHCWRTSGFFTTTGNYKCGCYKHNRAYVLITYMVYLLSICPGVVYLGPQVVLGTVFWGTHQTDFQNSCTSLQSHQQWRSTPLAPHPHQDLLSPEFLILAIMTGVRWNLKFVLICISMTTKNVENFFRCFSSAIWVSSVENPLFISVPHF